MRRLDLDARLGRAAPDALFLAVLAYLLLPALLFAGGFLWWPVAAAAVGAGLAGAALSPGWRAGWPLGGRATLACVAGGLAWALLATGTHHLLYAAVDWQIRDAVLHDLARGGWPVVYAIGDISWLLRAPLGYYLVPALAGPSLALAALYLWTALGLSLVLALLVALAREAGCGRRGVLVVAAVFVGFGGLDLIPNLWLDATQGDGVASYFGRGGEWWARHFQYSGHATLLLWAPNHALPGWLPALLLARHARRHDFAAAAGLPLAAALACGPLSALGAAVLTVWAILAQGRAGITAAFAGLPNWLALLLAAPLALFLTAGATRIPHGWLVAQEAWGALGNYVVFMVVEVVAVAALVRALLRWRVMSAVLALLALLPLYEFGPGNEMAMRGAIAPLALLALASGLALASSMPGLRRGVLAGVLAFGAAGQAMEASILTHPAWPASQRCSLPEAAAQSVFSDTDWSHYVVPWPEALLRRLLTPPEPILVDPASMARCWP